MANDTKVVREVATCVRTLLKTHGHDLTRKDIMALIQDRDLEDPVALTQTLAQELDANPPAPAATPPSERRQQIASFFVTHRDLLEQNPHVRDALLHGYTIGRYDKETREQMKQELLDRAAADTAPATDDQTQDASGFQF